jgi:hypothetical protein
MARAAAIINAFLWITLGGLCVYRSVEFWYWDAGFRIVVVLFGVLCFLNGLACILKWGTWGVSSRVVGAIMVLYGLHVFLSGDEENVSGAALWLMSIGGCIGLGVWSFAMPLYRAEFSSSEIKTMLKLIITCVGCVLALILAPIGWCALSATPYYYGARCKCGKMTFIRITERGWCSFSPGHGEDEHPFPSKLRRTQDGGWELLGPAYANPSAFSPEEYKRLMHTNDIAFYKEVVTLRIYGRDGALYTAPPGTTNWDRSPRVYNIWEVWLPKLQYQKERFLGER